MGARIDLGCGGAKKPGTIGIDHIAQDGVDHVVDLEKERLPFADRSVEYVHSSHFLEHVKDPTPLFGEISRVAENGAQLEFWTPYAWENSAFIIDHKLFYNEDHYLHLGLWFTDFWKPILHGARWVLREFVYVVEPPIVVDLYRRSLDLDFAIRHLKGVVKEFGAFIEVRHGDCEAAREVPRSFATERNGDRHPLHPIRHPADAPDAKELQRAIAAYARR